MQRGPIATAPYSEILRHTACNLRERVMSDITSAAAFPKLTPAELECLHDFAQRVSFREGETLFRAGERDYGFFVVTKGEVEILDHSSGTRSSSPCMDRANLPATSIC